MFQRLLVFLFLLSLSLSATETVKIGVLAKRSPAITEAKWSATATFLSSKIPGYTFVIVPLNFDELAKSVAEDQIDFVLTNTMMYVELRYHYGISSIATLKNTSSSGDVLTSFGGVIVTKKESPIHRLEDLNGKRFGAVDHDSFGGWVMAQKELYDQGIGIDAFSDIIFVGSHDGVISAINSGEIDAGTVRTDTLEQMAKEGSINLNAYRVLAEKHYEGFPFKVSTALYPEWPFAKLASTSESLTVKVLSALLSISPDHAAAKASQTAGWTIPLDYSGVENVLMELDLFQLIQARYLTFSDFYNKYHMWFTGLIVGLLAVLVLMLYIFRLNSRLRDNKAKIEAMNAGLEQKINDRMGELTKLYIREKYLKNFLNTISEVNEKLIVSLTTEEVITNSLLALVKHPPYRYVLIGLTEENKLMTFNCSSGAEGGIEHSTYRLGEMENSAVFEVVKRAMEKNRPVVETLPEEFYCAIATDSCICPNCMIISLPLKKSDKEPPIGHLSILSDREEGFEPEEIRNLEKLAMDIGLTFNAIRQSQALEEMERQKVDNYEETVLAFVNIIEQRDSYTAGHTIRVAKYSRLIAEAMHLSKEQILVLEKAAILHDIGKVVTPDAILLKPGKLTPLEYELIKQHSDAGYKMLSQIDMYKDLAEIIYYHHVHYDGKGYPALPEYDPEAVDILSYVMAAADAFDAMTTNRIYKSSKTREEAINEIRRCSGTQFHPDVALAAAEALKDVSIVDTTQLPDNRLEHHRFSYFFLDALTDLYNENYLKTIIGKKKYEQGSLILVQLKRFSDYNQQKGWNAGNSFLKAFGGVLKELYPEALVFRYHGDGYALLFEQPTEISKPQLTHVELLYANDMDVHLHAYDLKDGIPDL